MMRAIAPAGIPVVLAFRPAIAMLADLKFGATDTSIANPIAAHTASTTGPDHIRNAAGPDARIHGNAISTSSHSGASDAPRRHPTHTSTAAATTMSSDVTESGKTATRASPMPVNASVACDSHAASAVARAATAPIVGDTADGRVEIDGRMSRILHGATSGYHRAKRLSRRSAQREGEHL